MTEQKHTPGPLTHAHRYSGIIRLVREEMFKDGGKLCVATLEKHSDGLLNAGTQTANARLLAASYNAFDTAAARLNLNAVEFAERMQEGVIADLVEALGLVVQMEYDRCEESRNFDEDRLRYFAGLIATAEGRS